MSILRFRAEALTPVHIGTGAAIAPEEYLLKEGTLVRFNAHAVLADMGETERKRYEEALDQGDLVAAQRLLRGACDPASHALYRTRIGAGAERELGALVGASAGEGDPHAARLCEVRPLLHNPVSGGVVVPGSSIKGALRTALVNHYAQRDRDRVRGAVDEEPNKDRRWQALEQSALNYQRNRTEGDPLRLLRVADSEIPPSSAQVDRATVIRKGGADKSLSKIQIHIERLLSRADAESAPGFEVEIEIDAIQAAHPTLRELLGRVLDWPLLAAACNDFYRRRMAVELDHFFPATPGDPSPVRLAVLNAWNAGSADLTPRAPGPDEILLRVGRYSHFESLSVDELREGWNVQKRQPIDGMGATRTLCATRSGVKVPCGWLRLRCLDGPIDAAARRARDGARRLPPSPHRDPMLDASLVAAATARSAREQRHREAAEALERERAEAALHAAELASLSPEQRSLRELAAWLTEDRETGRCEAGGRLANRTAELLREAPEWPREIRLELADLGAQVYALIGWGSGKKKKQRRAVLAALREESKP